MSAADWCIVAVVVISVILAAAQGFISEVVSLAGLLIGFLAAAWNYQRVASIFGAYLKSQQIANLLGFFTIFFLVVLLAAVVARVVRWAVSGIGLRWFDRLLGAAFGLVRGVLFATVLVMAVAAFAPGSSFLVGSQLAPYLLVLGRGASWLAPSQVRQQFGKGIEALKDFRVQQGYREGLSSPPQNPKAVKQ